MPIRRSDDEAVAMGGAIARYVAEGKKVIKVVFSYGQFSHPHLKEEVVIKHRVEETKEANKFIGISETLFFGLSDTKIKTDAEKYGIKEKVKFLINKYKPEKIFMPSALDPHPDHQAVNKIVLESVDELKKPYQVFAFEVWNIIKETHPALYIDITPYFAKKLKFMKLFKSQWQSMYALWIPVYIRARSYGRKNNCKYAERFYKLR